MFYRLIVFGMIALLFYFIGFRLTTFIVLASFIISLFYDEL